MAGWKKGGRVSEPTLATTSAVLLSHVAHRVGTSKHKLQSIKILCEVDVIVLASHRRVVMAMSLHQE